MDFGELTDLIPSGEHSSDTGVTILELMTTLKGKVLCCEERLGDVIYTACGCDLMSDVLAFSRPGSVLLTGLTNNQVVRTAGILDLKAIFFVRDKMPDDATISLAKELGIPLLSSPYPLFESCGLLYSIGVKGCTTID